MLLTIFGSLMQALVRIYENWYASEQREAPIFKHMDCVLQLILDVIDPPAHSDTAFQSTANSLAICLTSPRLVFVIVEMTVGRNMAAHHPKLTRVLFKLMSKASLARLVSLVRVSADDNTGPTTSIDGTGTMIALYRLIITRRFPHIPWLEYHRH